MNEFDTDDISKIKFVTDRGSNVKKALNDNIRISCSNHLLSNLMDAAFEDSFELMEIINTCKNLVKYFKKANLQHLLNTSLKNHCPTRWNSYLLLFQSINDNWADINAILLEKNCAYRIAQISHTLIKSLFYICKDIDKISMKLQGSKYTTLCYVLPAINRLKKICAPNAEDVQLISLLKENILKQTEKTWCENISIWHKAASFLFPPTINMAEISVSIHDIKKFCLDQIFLNNQNESTTPSSSANATLYDVSDSESIFSSSPINIANTNSSNTMTDFQFFFLRLLEQPSLSLNERASLEIEQYLTEKVQLNESFDVFKWWDQNCSKYSLLSILSIPASSAPSERVFSLSGNIICEKRNRLAPKIVDSLIFLHSILKQEQNNKCNN